MIITNNKYLSGNDNIDNARPCPSYTQQSAMGKGGGGGGNEDKKEEDSDGCWRVTSKAVVASAKRKRVQ
jgi:hypothetical protein